MTGSDGYPIGWQDQFPGPWPLGMPIWLDSWGPQPPLIYYGNGTSTPGPMLPGQYIAQTTIDYNAGRGPALEPIPLELMMKPSPPPLPLDPTGPDWFPTTPPARLNPTALDWFPTRNPPVGAAMAQATPFSPFSNPVFANQRAQLTGYSGAPVYSRAGDIINAASGLCEGLDPKLKAACQAAAAIGQIFVGGAGGAVATAVMNSGGGGALSGQCPAGYTWSSTLNRCISLAAALPGGQPMTLTRNEPTQGGLGMAAVTPLQVGTIMRNDGSSGPILRCPRKYVLGQDYMCYPKSMIPNQLRAHPRGTRPLLTGGEVKILRRAKSLEKKVTKLGHQFGKKTCHCGPKKTARKK